MLKTRDGFSMVQVIIAAGMMAALSLGMMKIIEMQNSASKKSSQDLTISSLTMEMNSYLAQAQACENSLKGETPDGSAFVIKDRSGTVRYKGGQKVGTDIKVEKISLEQPSTPVADGERGVLAVKLKLRRLGRNARTITKTLKVMATLDGAGSVKSCESYETDAIETGIQRSCESIGGIMGENECHFEDALFVKLIDNPLFIEALAGNPAFVARFASSLVASNNQAAIEATRSNAAVAAASNKAAIAATSRVAVQLDKAMAVLENSTEADLETMQASQKEALKIIGEATLAMEQNRITSEQNNLAIAELQHKVNTEILKLQELKGNLYKIAKAQENIVLAKQSLAVAQANLEKAEAALLRANQQTGRWSFISRMFSGMKVRTAKTVALQAKEDLADAESYLVVLNK